jgi:hypothetical protein
MGSGGRAQKVSSSDMAEDSFGHTEDGTFSRMGIGIKSSFTSTAQSTLQRSHHKKFARVRKTAVIFNSHKLSSLGTKEPKAPFQDIFYIEEVKNSLKAAQQENARLHAENESLIRSLFVKTDILKATMTAKNKTTASRFSSAAAANNQYAAIQDEHQELQRSYPTNNWIKTLVANHQASQAGAAARGGGGNNGNSTPNCTFSMDSPLDSAGADDFTSSPNKVIAATYHGQDQQKHEVSSINCVASSEIDYSDVTSRMIAIRGHQVDLKLLLQEAEEEGLTTDLLVSIESAVAETSKIYSNLMSQRREHPAITNKVVLGGDFNMKLPGLTNATSSVNSENKMAHPVKQDNSNRAIATVILQRLSQQKLLSLHGSWQAHSHKLEVIQQKQSRLEVMRSSLANAIQSKAAIEFSMNVSWNERASAFLASDYLEKSARVVYWEEWDAIDTFEGTCCEVRIRFLSCKLLVLSRKNNAPHFYFAPFFLSSSLFCRFLVHIILPLYL